MFIGHYAVAMAAKRAAPKTSLGTLILAAQFVDLLWPLFLLLGLEHVRIAPGSTAVAPLDFYDYPYSHSLLSAFAWAAAFGIVYFVAQRSSRGAWVAALCVLSHWLLDYVVHRPDLPLWPGSPILEGLGLWNSVFWTVTLELGMFVAGTLIYVHFTRTKDRTGIIALYAFCAVLVLIYAANLLGPPPPSVFAIAIAGNLGWLFVLWGYWIDRHRAVTGQAVAA